MGFLTRALWALCVARLWLMPLPSSFWIDEMGTVFVVRMGARHASLAAAPQVPASLYFWLARAAEWVFERMPAWAHGVGAMETVYRLPSVVCLAVASWVVARVAARLIAPEAAWLAAFACLALRGFDYQAADARPYALGTLLAAASVLLLIRWLDGARVVDAVGFVAVAALLWRVQPIYWPFYGVFASYAAARLWRKETPVSGWMAAGTFAALGVLLIPVAMDAAVLFRQAGAHVIVPRPGISELWRSLKMGLVALCGVGAWVWGRGWRQPRRRGIAPAAWCLIAAWWLAQPLTLFAFSWLSGTSVFVDRYLSLALPGAALAATACAGWWLGERWRAAALVLGVGVLALLGQWRQVWPWHHNSDWRGAALAINALGSGPEMPVLAPSPFIEARRPAWSPEYPLPGFLYAHFLVYPVVGKPLLLPYQGGLDDLARLAGERRLVVYGPYGSVSPARERLAELGKWRERRLGDFGDVEAILFEAR